MDARVEKAQSEIIAHLFSSFAAHDRETMTCFSSLNANADQRLSKACHRLILEAGAQKNTVLKIALDRLLRVARCHLRASVQDLAENHEARVRWVRQTSEKRLEKARKAARMELDASTRLSRALLSEQQARLVAERCRQVEVLVEGYSAEVRACRAAHARLSSEKEALCNSQLRLKGRVEGLEEELAQYRQAEAGQAAAVGEWHAENQKRVLRIAELEEQLQDAFSQIEKLQHAVRTKSQQVEAANQQLRIAEQDASSLQFRVQQLEHAVQAAKDAIHASKSEIMQLNQHNARLVGEARSVAAKCRVEVEVREGVERELGEIRGELAAVKKSLDLSDAKAGKLVERLKQCEAEKFRLENLSRTQEQNIRDMKLAMIKSIKSQQDLQQSISKLKKQREADHAKMLALKASAAQRAKERGGGAAAQPSGQAVRAEREEEEKTARHDAGGDSDRGHITNERLVRVSTTSITTGMTAARAHGQGLGNNEDPATLMQSPQNQYADSNQGLPNEGKGSDCAAPSISLPHDISKHSEGDMTLLSKQLEADLRAHLEAELSQKARTPLPSPLSR